MGVSEEMLASVVPDAVATVLSGLGFTVRKERRWEYRAESESAEVSIGYNYNYLRVMVRPISAPPGEEHDFVESPFVLEALAPGLPEAERYPRDMTRASSNVVRGEVNRQLRLLMDYCQPLLRGERGAWSKVEGFMREWWEFRRPKEGESTEHFANRLRVAAFAALQDEHHWTALDLYDRIPGGYLTSEDRKRRRQAGKHTFPMR